MNHSLDGMISSERGKSAPPDLNGAAPGPCNSNTGLFRLNKDSSKCLDVGGGKVVNGAAVQIWGCNGQQQQSFKWCSDGRIVSTVNDKMCLDVPGGDPSKPNNLEIWECNSNDGQYWGYDSNNMAIYSAKLGEKMCIDVVGGATKPGTPVNIYYCSPGTGEKWLLGNPPAPPPMPKPCTATVGLFRLAKDNTKCLDIGGGKVVNGAVVQIWNCNGQPQQNFMWCSDGRIVSAVNNKMCVDVPGGDPNKAGNLQLWECNSGGGQYWGYDSNNQGIYPSQTGEKMCMDVAAGSTKPGTVVNIWKCKPGTGEKWLTGSSPSPTPPTPCSGNPGLFRLSRDKSKCLDIGGGKVGVRM